METSAGTNSQSLYSIGSEDSGFYDPENIITPDDLLCFAWQIASGMVCLLLFLLYGILVNSFIITVTLYIYITFPKILDYSNYIF